MGGREVEATPNDQSAKAGINSNDIDRLAERISRDKGLFRTLIELDQDILFMHYDHRIVYANTEAAIAVGFTSGSEVVGRSLTEFVPPEDWARVVERIKLAAQIEGRTPPREHILIDRSGNEVLVESTSGMVLFDDKPVIVTRGRLIGPRKQAEEALRISEQRAQLALAASRAGLWDWRIQDGQVYFSPRYYTMLGYEAGEFGPSFEAWKERLHPEDRDRVLGELEAGLASGSDFQLEFRLKTKGGDYRWITSPCTVTDRDETGTPLRVVGTHTDVTEQRRLQAALKTSEERFHRLFECLTEGVALHEVVYQDDKSVDYRLIDVNQAFTRHTGLSRDQVVGRLASQLYGSGQPPYLDIYTEVAKTGKPHRFTTYFKPLERHFGVSVMSPQPGQFATVFSDITEQVNSAADRERLITELEAKQEDMELFLYTVSHDLKSPLITIKGFLNMIKQDIAAGRTDRLDSDMNRINSAADKMKQLLDELLSLSRIGRMDNPHRWISSVGLVREAIELVAGRINLNQAEVIIDETMPRIYGDGARLRELFQNLIDNAVKFAGPDPTPKILVGHRLDGDEVVYFVRDNGPGVDKKYRDRIFGLFNKLSAQSEGTGLGLALVKRIVEAHDGRIWVEAPPDKNGAVFCFTLSRPKDNGDKQDED